MKKLSQINELFSSSMKRHIEGTDKKEDSLIKFEEFISNHNRREIDYYIEDNKVCCKNNVEIYDDDLIDGKLPFQFGRVDGYFDCSKCKKLESLEGAPQEVGGRFICKRCGKNFTKNDLPEGTKIEGKFLN